ncbi:MAG: GNAT family N-acetyltransferase [Ktedonobacteraceae bacterium]|nr:GNAT family N-acetyltransferase [Ktedonobacteraceae bacterium]
MSTHEPTKKLVIRLATPEDIATIEELDSYSQSPTRNIHRDMEKYFGSVDPSFHEHTFIFLAEQDGQAIAKAELMVPPADSANPTGYIKRVIVHPHHRGLKVARQLMQHVIHYARETHRLAAIDLHVWEGNQSAIKLYEALGFQYHHRETYYRLPLPPSTNL